MLRTYQQKAIDEIRAKYSKGNKKVLLHLATGAGKTVVFCYILKKMFDTGKSAIMVVKGRKLVDQASQRLVRENVPHGVLMANHWNYRPHERIQVCSIDTLKSRGLKPNADLIVIDEAHLATSPSYIEFLEQYPNTFMLPVTATPYMDKSLAHCAETVVHPVTVKELIEQGFLVAPKYFAPNIIDTSGIKIKNGDYDSKQLDELVNENTLVGDIVTHYKDIAPGRPALCFAVSIDHSKHIVEEFNKNGIRARHCDANSSDKERNAAIEDLRTGKICVLSNVGIFCIGVDIPFLACIIMARPTKSYNLYIQQAGRGSRIYPENGKKDFIILDHASNVLNHGFITEEKEANIDPKKQKKEKFKIVNPKVCKVCFAVYIKAPCPNCGAIEKNPKEFAHIDGQLTEITDEPIEIKIKRFITEKKKLAKERGYKRGWVYHKIVDEYGEEIANQFMPKRIVPEWVDWNGRI